MYCCNTLQSHKSALTYKPSTTGNREQKIHAAGEDFSPEMISQHGKSTKKFTKAAVAPRYTKLFCEGKH